MLEISKKITKYNASIHKVVGNYMFSYYTVKLKSA